MSTFNVKQSGSFSRTYTLTDPDGNPRDLTGYTVTASTRMKRKPSVGLDMTVSDDDLPNGVVTVSLTPTDTASMPASQWEFDVKSTSADGLTVYYTDTDIINLDGPITGASLVDPDGSDTAPVKKELALLQVGPNNAGDWAWSAPYIHTCVVAGTPGTLVVHLGSPAP